jgi:flavin reductase (DIM6/NTAB) family NADH-FMN oxidoreductase RutF
VIIDPSNLEVQEGYKLLIGSVVPRPIAWTSTVSREGTYNLAPFSFFTVASRKVSSRKPSCLVEVFSETLIQQGETLFNRIGAKGRCGP